MKLILCLCLWLCGFWFSFVGSDYCGPWVPLDVTSIPKAPHHETFTVRFVAAPLLYCTYGDSLAQINAYHGGLIFVNDQTGKALTFNFDAFPGFMGAFIPTIKVKKEKTELIWENFGKIFVYEGQNYTYWHIVNETVATITGKQFNHFINWVVKLNSTLLYYDPWGVYYKFPNHPAIEAFDCFQWVDKALLHLRDLGGKLLPGVSSLYHSLTSFYVEEKPQLVDMSDRHSSRRVTEFYEMIQGKWLEGYKAFMDEIYRIATEDQFFVHKDNSYYALTLSPPFFEIHWTKIDILSLDNMYNKKLLN